MQKVKVDNRRSNKVRTVEQNLRIRVRLSTRRSNLPTETRGRTKRRTNSIRKSKRRKLQGRLKSENLKHRLKQTPPKRLCVMGLKLIKK